MKGILLDENGDLLVRNGSLVVGDITYQNQTTLLKAHKGEIKEFPLVGVGIEDVVNDNEFPHWTRIITDELEKDGQRIKKLKIDANGLELEAEYK